MSIFDYRFGDNDKRIFEKFDISALDQEMQELEAMQEDYFHKVKNDENPEQGQAQPNK